LKGGENFKSKRFRVSSTKTEYMECNFSKMMRYNEHTKHIHH